MPNKSKALSLKQRGRFVVVFDVFHPLWNSGFIICNDLKQYAHAILLPRMRITSDITLCSEGTREQQSEINGEI